MKSSELSYKTKMTPADLSALFKGILKSLEEGTIVLETEGKFVALEPGGSIEVEVEAFQKKDKEGLEISLNWKNEPVACQSACLKVSSKEPVAPVVEAVVPSIQVESKPAKAEARKA